MTIACSIFRFRGIWWNHSLFTIKHLSDWILKHFLETSSCESTTFKIQTIDRLQLLSNFAFWQSVASGWWPQIDLIPHKNTQSIGNCLMHFIIPLHRKLCYTFDRVGKSWFFHNWKSDKEDVRIRVSEGSQSGILLLACCIPKSEFSYQRPKLTIFPSVFIVVVELSKIVGTYSVGKRFWV